MSDVIGIDCDSKQITIVHLSSLEGKWLVSLSVLSKKKYPMDRFTELICKFNQIISRLYEYSTVERVFIEEPIFIQNPRTSLVIAYIVGYLCSFYLMRNISVSLVNNKKWKQEVVGNGAASKKDIQEFVNLKWGINSETEHVADATCIAEYGRRLLNEKS